MPIDNNNLWIASSMIDLAESIQQQSAHAIQAYLCYWIAWTNIYKALSKQAGLRPHFGLRKNGTLRIKRDGDLKMAEVYAPTEDSQLNKALDLVSDALKHQLIVHPDTRYFVYRTPAWQGKPLKKDTFGQPLNGVIYVNRTLDPRYPVWSHIDTDLYQLYMEEKHTDKNKEKARNTLTKQILNVLHTIQANLIHGDIQSTENNAQIVEKALPILSMLVTNSLNVP